jgi:Pyridine nucleotide-disulphide oxidoreductase, dimerisation domain
VAPGFRGRLLGVHILGPRAGELIHEWVLAMQKKNGVTTLADLIHVYPTLSMANQHAAQRWYQQLGESRRLRRILDLFFRLRGFAPDPRIECARIGLVAKEEIQSPEDTPEALRPGLRLPRR